MTGVIHQYFVYQTEGSGGRKQAKYHRPNLFDRASCCDLVLDPDSGMDPLDLYEERLCGTKACDLRTDR